VSLPRSALTPGPSSGQLYTQQSAFSGHSPKMGPRSHSGFIFTPSSQPLCTTAVLFCAREFKMMMWDSTFKNRGRLINGAAAVVGHNGFTVDGTLSMVEKSSRVVVVENGETYGFHGGELRAHLLHCAQNHGPGHFSFWINPFTGHTLHARSVRRLRLILQQHGALIYKRGGAGPYVDEGSDPHAASLLFLGL
jgi:hypothetical protein